MKKLNPLEINKKTVKKLNQLEMQFIRAGIKKKDLEKTDVTHCESSCCESGRTCDASNGGTCTC